MDLALTYYVIIFGAGFIQGFSGFGSVLFALPLLTMLLDVKTIVPLLTLLGLCINIALLVQVREHLNWKIIGVLAAAAAPGIAIGVVILKLVPSRTLELGIGTLIILFPLYILFARPPEREISAAWGWVFGFFSGVLGGSTGASGPPVIIYTSLQPWGKYSIKATMVGYFLISSLIISAAQTAGGMMTPQVLDLFYAGLLPLLAGVLLGSLLFRKVGSTGYRKVLAVLLIALGFFMILRTVISS